MYQPHNLTDPAAMHKELEGIQAFLEANYTSDNPAAVQQRFEDLAIYMARSGKLKADAEFHYNSLVESSIMDALKKGYEERLSASTINKFVESAARGYKFLVTWSDRVNRSCTHQLEAMRTTMSTLRSERFANNYGK